jgi:Family of unknown function (DUF5927)/Core-2/I-Branching enzyme
MTLGVIILAHTGLARVKELARYWTGHGAEVVLHLDAKVSELDYNAIEADLEGTPRLLFAPRVDCTWGTWSLVDATLKSAEALLQAAPDVTHVLLTSGACIPVRPAPYLVQHLEDHPDTDFIESVATADVPWAVSGLEEERFTLFFPFSWKKRRRLFDRAVDLQRLLRVRRRIPAGLVPHLGSQWWCLTRPTLEAILSDPERATYDRFFRKIWIPDEGYFQTLARKHARKIESRSLTFAKFDAQGRPHTFYDDHLHLLSHSGYFLARKIWADAGKLYDHFLNRDELDAAELDSTPSNVDQVLTKAAGRRQAGRPGLYMQSRFPVRRRFRQKTAGPFTVLEGFDAVFPDFQPWFQRMSGARLHGHLFDPTRVRFQGDVAVYAGCLTDNALLRDYDPEAFLTSLVWNARGEEQAFHFGPEDVQKITPFIASDNQARVAVITGAWALSLHHRDLPFAEKRKLAAVLQKTEAAHLELLQRPDAEAKVLSMTLESALRDPRRALAALLAHLGARAPRVPAEPPALGPTAGLTAFLQDLKNDGLRLHLVGNVRDIPDEPPGLDQVGARRQVAR